MPMLRLFSAALPQCQADDVRKFVPQLQEGNIEANQPVIDLLNRFAKAKDATNARISLAWMLRKWPNVIPIPGSKNRVRIYVWRHPSQIASAQDTAMIYINVGASWWVRGRRSYDSDHLIESVGPEELKPKNPRMSNAIVSFVPVYRLFAVSSATRQKSPPRPASAQASSACL